MNKESAMGAGLTALSRKDMTGAEVERLLLRRGFDPDQATSTVTELRQLGIIKEERTAGFVVEEVKTSRFKGRLSAENKLIKRGVDTSLTSSAMQALPPEEDMEKARTFILSKSWKSPAQAARALVARGFEEECILSLIEEVFPDA